ncbi:MAG: flavodoxin [Spirochaetes bacterium]|nr:flavodoxin [Spirochaetota bacterium]
MGKKSAAMPGTGRSAASEAKTLVVYYSRTSTTQRVAKDLAKRLGADIEAIADKKPRSKGFFGYMNCGRQATFRIAGAIKAPSRDPAAYEKVVVLTPVWSWKMTPPVRGWLRLMKGKLNATAFVAVSGNTEPEKIAADMAKESGAQPLAVAGFFQADFASEHKAEYEAKVAKIVDAMK